MDGGARLRFLLALHAHLRACRRFQAWRDVEGLLARLDASVDPDLRLHRFGEFLALRSSDAAAWIIVYLQARVNAGDPRARRVCTGLLDRDRLSRVLTRQRLGAIRGALEGLGGPATGLLGTGGRPGARPDEETASREPVGARISQARRQLPALLDRLLFDPDVRVVRALLGNPRLGEAALLRLAAARRATPEALRAIAAVPDWIGRYPVKVALANNPATPADLAAGILPHLLDQDLRTLAEAAARPGMRRLAASLLAARLGARQGAGGAPRM